MAGERHGHGMLCVNLPLLAEEQSTGEEADAFRTRWRREKKSAPAENQTLNHPATHNVQRPTKNQALLVKSLV
jgi:hypothetical protein